MREYVFGQARFLVCLPLAGKEPVRTPLELSDEAMEREVCRRV